MKIGHPPLPLFDRLCRISEDHFPDILKVLRKAKLFHFPGKPHEVLPKAHDIESARFLMDELFLPFDTIAIEDDASCVLLMDTVDGQRGCSTPRYFIDCAAMFAPADAFNDGPEYVKMIGDLKAELTKAGVPRDTVIVTLGTLDAVKVDETTEGKLWVSGSVSMTFAASKRGMIVPPTAVEINQQLTESALRHARCAVEEVMYFNQPSRFVVERKPVKRAPPAKHGKADRSYSRPVYTLLTPHEICETLRIEEPGKGTKKGGHWRRRHSRTMKSEFFKAARGKTILIEAKWIGPETAEVDGHYYRVCLEL